MVGNNFFKESGFPASQEPGDNMEGYFILNTHDVNCWFRFQK